MEQYKVDITKEALQNMEDVYNYIALELPVDLVSTSGIEDEFYQEIAGT